MKKSFDPGNCAIPTFYCGNEKTIPQRNRTDDKYYTRKGTQAECLSKGIGVGMAIERTKNLSKESVQQIKYVGDVYEANFKKHKINSISELINYASKNGSDKLETLLRKVFIKKGGNFDEKAYNSTLLYLYNKNINDLPSCIKL